MSFVRLPFLGSIYRIFYEMHLRFNELFQFTAGGFLELRPSQGFYKFVHASGC